MDFPITIERERVLTNNKRDQGFGKYLFLQQDKNTLYRLYIQQSEQNVNMF